MPDTCPSCGVAFTDHLGLIWTCAYAQRLRGLIAKAGRLLEKLDVDDPLDVADWQEVTEEAGKIAAEETK